MFITVHAKARSDSDYDYQDWVINTDHIIYVDPLKFHVEMDGKSLVVLGKEFPELIKLLTKEAKNG